MIEIHSEDSPDLKVLEELDSGSSHHDKDDDYDPHTESEQESKGDQEEEISEFTAQENQ